MTRVSSSWQQLAFYSKKLSGAGTRYSTFDRELLAAFSVALPPVTPFTWATHLGILAPQLGVSPRVKAPNPDATQEGGGVAWVALYQAFPQHKELVFCLVLLTYMTSGPFS
jgi:hypothetical protein